MGSNFQLICIWIYAEVITDEVTPERLEPAPQTEHTFLIEWGSDSMDRGNHDFETHEHGQLVVSTDFTISSGGKPFIIIRRLPSSQRMRQFPKCILEES